MAYYDAPEELNALPQAKIEKRSKRTLYEGSKLLDQHRKQVRLGRVRLKISLKPTPF